MKIKSKIKAQFKRWKLKIKLWWLKLFGTSYGISRNVTGGYFVCYKKWYQKEYYVFSDKHGNPYLFKKQSYAKTLIECLRIAGL